MSLSAYLIMCALIFFALSAAGVSLDHHALITNRMYRGPNPNLNCNLVCYDLVGFPHGFKKLFKSESVNLNFNVKMDERCVSYIKLIHDPIDVKVKIFRSNNGTEVVDKRLHTLFSDLGIIHQSFSAHPQPNSITQRKHRHLFNVTRCLMFQGGIPLSFWSECVLTAVYPINRLPSSVLSGKSPFKLLYKKKSNLSHLRCFGCLCVSTNLNNCDRMFFEFEKCILIGFSTIKKAYKLLSLKSRNVFYSKDVKFHENISPFKMKTCDSTDLVFTKEVDHLDFFEPQSPNDEGKDSSVVDGCMQPPDSAVVSSDTSLDMNQDGRYTATIFDDHNSSEGKLYGKISVPTSSHDKTDKGHTPVLRSDGQPMLSGKLNMYALNVNLKASLVDKVVQFKKYRADKLIQPVLNSNVKPKTKMDAKVIKLNKHVLNSKVNPESFCQKKVLCYEKILCSVVNMVSMRYVSSYAIHYHSHLMHSSLPKRSNKPKFRSKSSANRDIIWLSMLLHSSSTNKLLPVEVCCDNRNANLFAANSESHEKCKIKILKPGKTFSPGSIQHNFMGKYLSLLDSFKRGRLLKQLIPWKQFKLMNQKCFGCKCRKMCVDSKTFGNGSLLVSEDTSPQLLHESQLFSEYIATQILTWKSIKLRNGTLSC